MSFCSESPCDSAELQRRMALRIAGQRREVKRTC